MSDLSAEPLPARLRLPRSALIAVPVLVIGTLPLTVASPWWFLLLVLPMLIAAYIWRSGVDLGPHGVTVRAAFGTTSVGWPDVAGVQVRDGGRLWLARRDGGTVRLHTLRIRDLPRLHAASGGRLGLPDAADGHGPE